MDLLSQARERLDRGDYAGARDAADRALADAEQADDLGARVHALALLGEALLGLGDPFGAREALEAVYRLAWAPGALKFRERFGRRPRSDRESIANPA